jgi:Tol biopolymer transport system component
MKAKIIALIMMVLALTTLVSSADEIDAGPGKQISTSPGYVLWPEWSPDGKWIISVDGRLGIYLIPTDGGDAVKLCDNHYGHWDDKNFLCFSPDSQEVLFQTGIIDKTRGTIVKYNSEADSTVTNPVYAIKAININTKVVRLVKEEAGCPHFSKDGRYFGYVNHDYRAVTDSLNAEHDGSLAIFDTVTQETRYLGEAEGIKTWDFSFSGDGKYVAVLAGAPQQIYKIALDGTQAEQITNYVRTEKYSKDPITPSCSPDGRFIMWTDVKYEYLVPSNGVCSIQVYNTETKETKPLFPAGEVFNSCGCWSPDGKQFFCTLSLVGFGSSKSQNYIFDFNEENIGVRPVIMKVPFILPSTFGYRLARYTEEDIKPQDPSNPLLYSSLDTGQYFPKWSPDGKWIAMSTNDAIWIVSSEGGIPIKVMSMQPTDYKGFSLDLNFLPRVTGFTPDSQEILYEEFIIDESRGTVITIKTNESGGYAGFHSEGILPTMRAVNIYTGETRLVMDISSNGIYSHNGRYFAYNLAYPYSRAYDIMLYDTETQQTRYLGIDGAPYCFSHDDTYLVATVPSVGLLKIPLDGSRTEVLSLETGPFVTMSPDDRFLLYGYDQGIKLYDTVLNGSEYMIENTAGYECTDSSFSPDGKKICYRLTDSGGSGWSRIYVSDIDLSQYSVVTSAETSKPAVFALQGNYPNPFNPSTTIQFSLANAGKVNLTIYNVAGQKIRELVKNAELTPGIHHVLWNGHDDLGKPVSSGVYLTRLQMGGKSLAGRMLLMK